MSDTPTPPPPPSDGTLIRVLPGEPGGVALKKILKRVDKIDDRTKTTRKELKNMSTIINAAAAEPPPAPPAPAPPAPPTPAEITARHKAEVERLKALGPMGEAQARAYLIDHAHEMVTDVYYGRR